MKMSPRMLLFVLFLDTTVAFIPSFSPRSTAGMQRQHHHILATTTTLRDVESGYEELRFGSSPGFTAQLRQYSSGIQVASSDISLAMKPIRSLKRYIDSSVGARDVLFLERQPELGEALSSALIRAFRACGEAGDYRMIISLLQSAIQFCHDVPLLSARVWGEAVEALGRTDASVSKLKQVWRWAVDHSSTLVEPIGAFELNVMLKALGEKKKVEIQLPSLSLS